MSKLLYDFGDNISIVVDTTLSSVLVDRTAERNIMTDQTSECDSVSLTFLLSVDKNQYLTFKLLLQI